MTPDGIADAAQLAAQAPAGGVLSPRNTEIGIAWLDLRASRVAVSMSRVATVAGALGPCLGLQEFASLVVSSGEASPSAVAKAAAQRLRADGSGDLSIAALRGESLLGRLEEFLVAGCKFDDLDAPGETLHHRLGDVSAALAVPPSRVLSDAFGAGASIVVAGNADNNTLAELTDQPRSIRETGEVELWLHTGYRLTAVVLGGRERVEETLASVPVAGECLVETAALGDKTALTLAAETQDAISDACRRLDLIVDGLTRSLEDSVCPVYERHRTRVPADLLEFDYDIRRANAWIED